MPVDKMTRFRDRYRIESARLRGWDYASEGWYFVTVCTVNRECLLGEIIKSRMVLSSIGQIARQYWEEIPDHFPNVKMDAFIIMPNHIHGIINIDNGRDVASGRDVACYVSTRSNDDIMSNISPVRGSLGTVIRSYKSAVTRWCRKRGRPYVVWQPRFYDHVVRNEESLNRIRGYIRDNPVKWVTDKERVGNLWI